MKMSIKRMRELLCSAFEGGSNYWYRIDGKILRPSLTMADFKEGGSQQPTEDEGGYFHWSQLVPTVPGCALLVSAPGEFKAVVLNVHALRAGAQVMFEKYPQHFADILSENDDATTGDVFLQCTLYGEVIFG